MQDKNKLGNMAERYKEEMMRLYRSKPKENLSALQNTVSESAAKDQIEKKPFVHKDTEIDTTLTKPPVPNVPDDYGTGVNNENKNDIQNKFPSAEEILQAETATKAIAVIATITTDPRFESAENLPHNQGNYNYDAPEPLEDLEDYIEEIIPEIDYPDEDTDFEDLFDDDDDRDEPVVDMKGTGYLQVEVTTGDGAVPVPKAAVIVTQELGGQSYLVTMKLTDRSGTTDIIPLPAPLAELSEAPDPTERPFSEYNVTVYKKGFYTVPEVTVPIFDTVKSIQPVPLIPLAENELQGTQRPDGGTTNG